jgi:hypothetical protein
VAESYTTPVPMTVTLKVTRSHPHVNPVARLQARATAFHSWAWQKLGFCQMAVASQAVATLGQLSVSSHLGLPQMVWPNVPSVLGLLSVMAQFSILRALMLLFSHDSHCGISATRAVWLSIHVVALSHRICLYFYSQFMSLVAEVCLTQEPRMVSLKCI